MIHAFYADPHFGHKRICRLAGRPFLDVIEMNVTLINNYNLMVSPSETVLWLGDAFFYTFEESLDIFRCLNGKKIIVRGNHDRSARWLLRAGFDLVIEDWVQLQVAGVPVRACHYPYRYKDDRHDEETQKLYPIKRKGEVLIHGHTHGKERMHGNQIHVGVDAWRHGPVPYWEVDRLIRAWKRKNREIMRD